MANLQGKEYGALIFLGLPLLHNVIACLKNDTYSKLNQIFLIYVVSLANLFPYNLLLSHCTMYCDRAANPCFANNKDCRKGREL